MAGARYGKQLRRTLEGAEKRGSGSWQLAAGSDYAAAASLRRRRNLTTQYAAAMTIAATTA